MAREHHVVAQFLWESLLFNWFDCMYMSMIWYKSTM